VYEVLKTQKPRGAIEAVAPMRLAAIVELNVSKIYRWTTLQKFELLPGASTTTAGPSPEKEPELAFYPLNLPDSNKGFLTSLDPDPSWLCSALVEVEERDF